MDLMQDIKILINSSPRSGHTWLQYLLLESINHDKNVSMGEIEDQFIIRSNAPVILLGSFTDILQTTVLRNPKDIIPSIVTKTMGGLGSTIASGIPMPHEYNNLPPLERLVADQFDVYKRWAGSTTKNIDNLYAITFEQISQDPNFVVNYIMKNFNFPYRELQNSDIDILMAGGRKMISQHDKGDPAFNNPLPVDKKPEIYYEIADIVNNHPKLQECLDIHQNSVSIILDSQEKRLNG